MGRTGQVPEGDGRSALVRREQPTLRRLDRQDLDVAKPGHRRTYNQKSMQRLLEANGWTATVGGKHQVKMPKPDYRPITLPMNHGRDYPVGLAVAIMRQAGLRGGTSDGGA